MRRLLNFCLLLVVVGAIGFVLIKAKLVPSPFGQAPAPDTTPEAVRVSKRDVLRVAVAHRPEKFLVSALQRLLDVDGYKVELVEFRTETVWMELATGEIDMVFAPVGEAVKAQARFRAGHFLFFSGLSQGYDRIIVRSGLNGAPKSIGIGPTGGSELFALRQFPEAHILRASKLNDLSEWISKSAVDASVLESARLTPQQSTGLTSLVQTSPEKPLPTVAVISRVYTQDNQSMDLTRRLEVLAKALESWQGLVSYLDSQPELLRSTLKKAAVEEDINIEVLLRDYRFLTPSQGRTKLEEEFKKGVFRETLDLLVLVQVANLTTPDWEETLKVPAELQDSVQAKASTNTPPVASPSPEATATPVVTPSTAPPDIEPPPEASDSTGTFIASTVIPRVWPKSSFRKRFSSALQQPLSVSQTLVAFNTSKGIEALKYDGKKAFTYKTSDPLTGPTVFWKDNLLGATGQQLLSISPRGKKRWTKEIKGEAQPDLLIHEDQVLVTLAKNDNGKLLCIDPDDGETIWETKLADPPASSPIFARSPQNHIIVADTAGRLKAYSFRTGRLLWTKPLGKATYIRLSSYGDKIVVAEPDGRIRLYSAKDGKLIWTAEMGSSLNAPATPSKNVLLVPAKDTYLYCLKIESGDIAWKTRLDATLSEPAMVSGDSIFQADESGKVYSLQLSDGALTWSKSLGKGWLSRPTISPWGWGVIDFKGVLTFYKS